MSRAGRSRARARRPALRLLGAVAALVLALVVWSGVRVARIDVAALAHERPGETALMRERAREARRDGREPAVKRRWVPLERISPDLTRAVLIAEDDAFFSHGGLDWNEIEASARRNWQAGRIVRGGSTITQQLAKNLWLGSSRNPVRKLEELMLALRLERAIGKRRILELYLNVIEWGDGVYGAEAAARHWYGVPASALSPRQAVVLAAVIINPRRYSPAAPSRRIERRVRLITQRMVRRGLLAPDPPAHGPAGAAASVATEPPSPASLPVTADSAAAPAAPDSAGH